MADNDYNIIKPVESLQNIKSLAFTKRRKEGRKQHSPRKKKSPETELTIDELLEEIINSDTTENDQDEHSIDYRA